jgi:hypothetical protein
MGEEVSVAVVLGAGRSPAIPVTGHFGSFDMMYS